MAQDKLNEYLYDPSKGPRVRRVRLMLDPDIRKLLDDYDLESESDDLSEPEKAGDTTDSLENNKENPNNIVVMQAVKQKNGEFRMDYAYRR